MASKAMTDKPEPRPTSPEWTPAHEAAPSVMRADEPSIARIFGLTGLFFIIIGTAVLVTTSLGRASRIGPTPGMILSITGVACLLFHASRDTDRQIRRTYGLFGYLCLLAGILVIALPIKGWPIEVRVLPYGFAAFTLALLFLLPFARNEDEERWRLPAVRVLGAVGAILALVGFFGSNVAGRVGVPQAESAGVTGVVTSFVLPYGVLLTVLGLFYLWSFIGLVGPSTDLGYRTGLALGALGVIVFIVALGRSLITPLVVRGAGTLYFTSSGAILMGLGALYAAFSAGLCSDSSLVVLTRRELAGFFYSPIAYIVFLVITGVGWFVYWMFVSNLYLASMPGRQPMLEPIVRSYFWALFPVICVSLVVPIITMRMLSEEKRTGTLEVLLTAPLGETTIVLSKFLACLIFFMLLWIPWGLFLVGLRIEGGQPFDFRPLISFFIALLFTGAGFLAMGLFFSSLTRNQIVSAVLSAMGMILLLGIYFAASLMSESRESSSGPWATVLTTMSYIDLWHTSLAGKLPARALLFHLSAAVFWLFLTVKVLEARKWK